METARFYGLEVADLKSDRAVDAVILSALSGVLLNQADVVKAVKAEFEAAGVKHGVNKIRTRLEALVVLGLVSKTSGAHGAYLYTRAAP